MGHIKGKPMLYLRDHGRRRSVTEETQQWLNTADPLNPSGLCQCGCGRATSIAVCSNPKNGWIKGQPLKYIRGHRKIKFSLSPPNPSGLCQCGCEELTAIAKSNDYRDGTMKGCHRRFISGHSRRKSPLEYVEEDRGYKTKCWIWQRYTRKYGYGYTWDPVRKIKISAYRLYYERAKGPIPEGLTLDHLCRIPSCINPDHLEPVTSEENSRRAVNTRLNADRVRRMRFLSSVGVTYADLGRIFEISWQNAREICLRATWKDVA
jgi:hypothetical protein